MTLLASGTLEAGAKYQYLRTLVCGEALRQFDLLSAEIEITETLNIDSIIRCLSQYFPPVNLLKIEAHNASWNEKPRSLSVRRYAACLIDLNDYLASFLGATLTDKIGVTKLN